MAENGRTAGRTTTRRAWAGTMAGFDDLMVPIRPQAPNAVKRGDSQPEDGPLSVRQRPRITVYIDGFNLYYALLKPDPAVR
jgi:hypothetical protein